MRLGQLARKLSLRPSEIVDFLVVNNISIDDGSNTRLEEFQVDLILKKFAPFSTAEKVETATEKEQESVILPGTHREQSAISPEVQEEQKEIADGLIIAPESEEKQEVIKAQKIELQGLRVLGKIELPENKKKAQESAETSQPDTVSSEPGRTSVNESQKRSTHRQNRSEQRPRKNPIAVAREKEDLETRRKREAEAEYAKEQRTKNYYKKVKVSSPTKRARLIDEQSDEMPSTEVIEKPRTLLGRLMRWFRS